MTTADVDDELDETPSHAGETTAMPEEWEYLDQIVDEYLDLLADEEKTRNRKREIADLLIRRLGVGGRHSVRPGAGIRVQRPASVFKADKAREVLDDTQLAAISEARPSPELARQLLPPVLYDQLTVPNARPSVHVV